MIAIFAAVALATNTAPTGAAEIVGVATINFALFSAGALCAYRLGRLRERDALQRSAELRTMLDECHTMLAGRARLLGRMYAALQLEQQRSTALQELLDKKAAS